MFCKSKLFKKPWSSFTRGSLVLMSPCSFCGDVDVTKPHPKYFASPLLFFCCSLCSLSFPSRLSCLSLPARVTYFYSAAAAWHTRSVQTSLRRDSGWISMRRWGVMMMMKCVLGSHTLRFTSSRAQIKHMRERHLVLIMEHYMQRSQKVSFFLRVISHCWMSFWSNNSPKSTSSIITQRTVDKNAVQALI